MADRFERERGTGLGREFGVNGMRAAFLNDDWEGFFGVFCRKKGVLAEKLKIRKSEMSDCNLSFCSGKFYSVVG